VGSGKYSGSGFSLATGSETFKRKIGTQDKNTVSLNLSTNLTFSRLLDAHLIICDKLSVWE
jgi:hypothetical protein